MVPICAGWAQCQHGLPQGYFSSIVWGSETPPEGSLQPRHYYLAKVWDNHTVPLSFLVKVPLQLISEPNLFMLFLYGPHEKRLFQRRLWTGWLSVLKENKEGLCHIEKTGEEEDVAGWLRLCPDNVVLSRLTENVLLDRVNIRRLII